MDDFADIMDLPHHVSERRRKMTVYERAAQFSAFAALTGYDEAIDETARLTAPRDAMSEDDLAALDAAVRKLLDAEGERPAVKVTFFQPDARKAGGSYVTVSGVFRHYDAETGRLLFTDGTAVPVREICSLQMRHRKTQP